MVLKKQKQIFTQFSKEGKKGKEEGRKGETEKKKEKRKGESGN